MQAARTLSGRCARFGESLARGLACRMTGGGLVPLTKRNRIDTLRSVWLFEECTRRELDALATVFIPAEVEAGYCISREGSGQREFVVIVDGKADVQQQNRRLCFG